MKHRVPRSFCFLAKKWNVFEGPMISVTPDRKRICGAQGISGSPTQVPERRGDCGVRTGYAPRVVRDRHGEM